MLETRDGQIPTTAYKEGRITMEGYCERHKIPYEIISRNGNWYSECPKCRAEGLLDIKAASHTETLPKDQWTASAATSTKGE